MLKIPQELLTVFKGKKIKFHNFDSKVLFDLMAYLGRAQDTEVLLSRASSSISVQDSTLSHLLTPLISPLFSCLLSLPISNASFTLAYTLTFFPIFVFFVPFCPATAIVAFLYKPTCQQSCPTLVSSGLSYHACLTSAQLGA